MVESNIQAAQSALYAFFLHSVQRQAPETVLTTFRQLFSDLTQTTATEPAAALQIIVIANDPQEFRYTLKRICYILVNNWELRRQHEAVQALIRLLQDPALSRPGYAVITKRLRQWMQSFVHSSAFNDLKLFANRYREERHWRDRYTSYLLVPQYTNLQNPLEQREAARTRSCELKARFRFDLAMYTARAQEKETLESSAPPLSENPTVLGDTVLTLVKVLLLRPGEFSYSNLANVFRQQVHCLSYLDFKRAMLQYLVFALPLSATADVIKQSLAEPLLSLHAHRDYEEVSDALILRTCNFLIDLLLTQDRQQPSPIFGRIMTQGNPLYLVLVLLKIALFCRYVQTHLELRMADLIRYYEAFPETDCAWIINFCEMFRTTFAIFGDRTHYNLVRIDHDRFTPASPVSLDDYRIFSQMRHQPVEAPALILPTAAAS
ncbi:MAG: hypothetical protein F6J97_06450 [Leptolyngbya sp. SIO4C1]|nr:hypothetical protein [Leptolyngbya sp. SIO4C1]